MFFDSSSFKLMESGVSAAWLGQQLHQQNLSNWSTPGYKAKNLTFGKVLEQAQSDTDAGGLYRATITARDDTTVRPDGNNVDVDVEGIELYKAAVQYSVLLDKITGQFDNYKYVLNNAMK